MLDAHTWTDAAVGKLVGDKAVALRIDAEKQPELARRYQIDAYPTLLLLKADGTEIDRFVGFREPATFLAEFTSALAGKTALVRARAAVANASTSPDKVKARYQLGQELARSGQSAEALTELLWCYDEGMVGTGDLEHARELGAKLLRFDGSEETRALLAARAARAGHPGFFSDAHR